MSNLIIEAVDQHVSIVKINRPPNNFFDFELVKDIADSFEELAASGVRAIVLGSEGKHFCAGANFAGGDVSLDERKADTERLYGQALRLFALPIPVVAAVQGAAVGGGLGVACSADFRIATPTTRFHANFSQLGFHQGFMLSVSLPRIVGVQRASEMLMGSTKVRGEEAARIGLADRCVPEAELLDVAVQHASIFAGNAPLAVQSIKETLRGDLMVQLKKALEREVTEQYRLWGTADWTRGIEASLRREVPVFQGN